jgi:PAS domain S-box-containing protein
VPESETQGWMERALLVQSPAGYWVLDPDGQFRYARGNLQPLFGRAADGLRGAGLAEVLPEPTAQKWANRVRRVVGGETILRRERWGETQFGLFFFPLRAPDGVSVYAGGSAHDLSALGTAEKELRDTTFRMVKAQASERGRLARFLHDEVGQSLSAAGLQLDLLRMDFEAAAPGIGARTVELQGMLETIMAGVREFSYELNPDIVERAGLHAALDRLVGRTRKKFAGNLRLMDDSSLRFPPAVGSALYKIAAEALENALEHSGCSLIEVIIKSTPGGQALEVRDNGKGFDADGLVETNRGLGLLVMEHYAGQASVRLSIDSEQGKGTTVRAIYEDGGSPDQRIGGTGAQTGSTEPRP